MLADRLPVLAATLRDRRRSLAGWSAALAGITLMYVGLYPSFEAVDMGAMVEGLPEELTTALGYDEIGTAAGYIDSTVLGLLGPILLAVFAIGMGGKALAGAEEDGTLELELTAPVPRLRVLAERGVALLVCTAWLAVVVVAVTAALIVVLGLDVALVRLLAIGVGLWLFAAASGVVAMAAGAATGRRAAATGAGAAVAVGGFVLNAIGPLADLGWMTAVSPFTWYAGDVALLRGVDWAGYARLLALAVAAGLAGAWRFDRRDLLV